MMLFSQPAFLWGLLVLLIPIAVHLFNFRHYKKVYFSNVDRLIELRSESHRQSTLRRWLVLTARMLAITFIVLAFARPFIPSNEQALRAGQTVVSVYIDNSFSMESGGKDGSCLDVARRKAEEIAAAYSPADNFQLITSDMTGDQFRWLSRDEFLDVLSTVEPSPASPMMSEVAKRQLDYIRQSGAANRHAYLVGDFQQSTSDIYKLPADSLALITLVPVIAWQADNIYIDSVILDAPAYFVGGVVNAEAILHNGGSRDAEKVPVKLIVDGRERAVATVDIPSEASAKTTLSFTLEKAGWTDASIKIVDYPVTFDDQYYFTLNVGRQIRITELFDNVDNPYIAKLFSVDPAVNFSSTNNLSLQPSDYDLIILNELDNITSGEAQQLATWVDEGGSLLVIPTATKIADGISQLLSLLSAPAFDSWLKRTTKASTIDYGNSLYRGVFNGKNEDMEMPSVNGHYSFAAGGSARQDIITLADGSPLLAVSHKGNGKVYLFTTPLTTEWTNLVSEALFVPTLYNMALYSRPLPPASYNLGNNEPILLQGSYDLSQKMPQLSDGDSLSIIPDIRKAGNRQMIVPHGELKHAGIYRLADEHIAFNYSRRESDLRFLDPDDVDKTTKDIAGYCVLTHVDKPITDELRQRGTGHQLWRWCIIITLVALAAEIALLKIKPTAKKKR